MVSPSMTSFFRVIASQNGSHSIDQPEGKTLGQVKLVFGSSKVIPENKVTNKTEYTNTQQD